jgi:hypothetical protein
MDLKLVLFTRTIVPVGAICGLISRPAAAGGGGGGYEHIILVTMAAIYSHTHTPMQLDEAS